MPKQLTTDHVSTERLYKTLGERMKAARDLAGIKQTEAACELGYANSSPLSKLEGGYGDRGIGAFTLAHLAKAADFYGVSADYLLGRSEYYDMDPEVLNARLIGFTVMDRWERERERDVATLRWLISEVGTLRKAFRELSEAESELRQFFDRFVSRNAEFEVGEDAPRGFDEMWASARLLSLMGKLEHVMAAARREQAVFDSRIKASREAHIVHEDVAASCSQNTGGNGNGSEDEIVRLARLKEIEYEQVRLMAARRLRIRTAVLDRHVSIARRVNGIDRQLEMFMGGAA